MSHKKIERIFYLIPGIFLVIGLGILIGGFFSLFSCIHFKEEAVEIPGQITEISRYKDSDGEYHYRAHVTYEYSGKIYENVPLYSYSSSMYEGMEVTLYCNPENPGNVREGSLIYLGPFILLLVGGIFTLIGGIWIIVYTKNTLQNKKIKEQGRVLYATVEQIVINHNSSLNGVHPYVIYCTYRDDYKDITYRFKSKDIWSDPSYLFPVGNSIEVRVKGNDYSKYYVDVDAMSQKVIDYT